MALNIPINLMGVTSPSAAGTSEAGLSAIAPETAVQPTGASTDSQAAAQDGNTGGQASREQHAATYNRPPKSPDNAQTQSVVTAQASASQSATDDARLAAKAFQQDARTKALIESVSATSAEPSALFTRSEKVDRFAPPLPLPTAPILKGEAPTPIKTDGG